MSRLVMDLGNLTGEDNKTTSVGDKCEAQAGTKQSTRSAHPGHSTHLGSSSTKSLSAVVVPAARAAVEVPKPVVWSLPPPVLVAAAAPAVQDAGGGSSPTPTYEAAEVMAAIRGGGEGPDPFPSCPVPSALLLGKQVTLIKIFDKVLDLMDCQPSEHERIANKVMSLLEPGVNHWFQYVYDDLHETYHNCEVKELKGFVNGIMLY